MFLEIALYLFCYMCVGFILALFLGKNSVVDVLYGLGVLFATVFAYILSDTVHLGSFGPLENEHGWSIHSFALYVPLVLTTMWAVRLSYRIFRKNYGKPEDARYAAWRMEWMVRSRFYFLVRTFLQIFMLQGVVIFCIALPSMLVALYGAQGVVEWVVLVGLVVWIVGFFFEAVGDYQLDRHIRTSALDPATKGSIMTTGLWAYTRHPNYFGEICMWVGIALVSTAQMPTLLLAIACFISPALIAYLLIYVSGIPMLEKMMQQKTGWAEYTSKTPALVPWVGWK